MTSSTDERTRVETDFAVADRATSRDRLFFGLVVLEMVASLVLGAITIGQRSFWLDESVSGTLARAGFREVLENFLVTDATMSIYNTMLVVWRQFGTGDAFIRSLSLLCVAGTVPFVALVGRRLFGRTTGLVAAGIVSLSPIAVRYAQEARAYGVVLLLLTLSSYCLLRALDSGSTARWFTYAIVAAAACYAHNFALFVIVANVVVVALGPRPTVNRRSIAEAAGVFVLLLLPLGLATIEHGAAQIAWVEDPSLQKV